MTPAFPRRQRTLSRAVFHEELPAADLAALLATLEKKQPLAYKVLTLSLGLDGNMRHTLAQIAAACGITVRSASIQRLMAIGYLRNLRAMQKGSDRDE